MSILLDALRKSEQRKRAGDVPTIHSAAPASEGARRSVSPLAVGLVLVPLFLLAAWLTWRQYGAPAPPEQAPAPPAAAEASTTAAKPVSAEVQVPPAANAYRPASPVENLPPGPAVQRAPGNEQAEPEESGTTPAEPAATMAAGPAAPEPDSQQEADTWSPGQPQPISYWQLPENLRKEIGEIKITVFVYADEPADRFILLDGRRQAEGDTPRPGLKIESIEPEGVVFSYRLYRFVVRR